MSEDKFTDIARLLDVGEEIDESEVAMLRELAKADPWRGFEMFVDHDGERVAIEPGGWRDVGFLDMDGELPPNCPVIPLGMDDKHCYFLSPLGHVRTLSDGAGKSHITFLFGGRTRFLEWAWPRFGKTPKGASRPLVAGWAAEDALPALVNACALKGTFALEDQVRGRGAWLHDDGSLIYHAGDRVYFEGRWQAPGELGRHVYPGRPKIGRPAAKAPKAGVGSPGDALLEVLRTFNWERGELDARMMLGWAMTALVGGALNRRPVAFVTGEEGSGKSTLQELLRLLMNGALMSTSNTTQAGIYQKVRQDSVPIMVDEMEAKEDTRTTDKILELARISYSGDKMQRGGKDGVGNEFTLMSSFLGSSIAKPATDAQDDSRMAVFMLRPLDLPGRGPGEIKAKTLAEWARDADLDSPMSGMDVARYGRELLRRWFEWWPRWKGLLRVYRQALMTAGHDSRSADTFGPLAAAYHVATCDDMPSVAQVNEWLDWLRADTLSELVGREKSWKRCFMHMLQVQPETLKHKTSLKSIGDAIVLYRDNSGNTGEDLRDVLQVNGLALSWAQGDMGTFDTARLFVPAKHPALHALFEGTQWQGRMGAPGPWISVLRQAPRTLWENGVCGKGLDKKAKGIFIQLKAALDA